MSSILTFALFAAALVLVQGVAALPWLLLVLRRGAPGVRRNLWFWLLGMLLVWAVFVVLRLGLGFFGAYGVTGSVSEVLGRVYGSVLHLQLLADLFVVVFFVLLTVWPKGAAVALSAFREGVRQPMFWLIVGFAAVVMFVVPFLPYFTFGEDHLMVKELGQDIIMLMALVFGTFLASTSISEEIEGRTAVTLMSKPVSRRQFLLGKYVGILLAALVITGLLGWFFDWMMLFTRWYDSVDPTPFPAAIGSFLRSVAPETERQAFLRGAFLWTIDAADALPGLVLGFGQVMVLLAVAVCLATRLPVVANIVTCAVIYVVSHLSPILKTSAQYRAASEGAGPSTVTSMLEFMAKLFDFVLPGLQLFKPTQITDAPVPLGDMALYAGEVTTYALLYTVIVLLFGLVLFEDRDLA
jgi:ABC-type transport system involved in multi-copper enzyme maturation permease subunit